MAREIEPSQLITWRSILKKTFLSLALMAVAAVCAFPAAAGTVLTGLGMAPDATAPALLLATAPALLLATDVAAAAMARTNRMPQVGDLVEFHVGAHDPTFAQGSRLDAEITQVWSESCVNVVVTDAVGEKHSRTSVRLVPPGCSEPVGHFATYRAVPAEIATG